MYYPNVPCVTLIESTNVHVSLIVNVCTYRSSSSSAFIGHIQQFEYSAKGGGSREKERKKERGGERKRERERNREMRKIGR